MPIDYKDYPPDWLSRIRPKVLERAKSCCEMCGIANYTEYVNGRNKRVKVVLTIAHLDHDKENWDVKLERLAALCQKCHLNYDRPRHRVKYRDNLMKKRGLVDMFKENES